MSIFNLLHILSPFIYSGEAVTLSEEEAQEYTSISMGSIDPAVMSNTTSNAGIVSFMVSLVYAICIVIIVYTYLILFAYWLEHTHVIGTANISLFKLMTFGKMSAEEVEPMHILCIFVAVNLVFSLIVTGIIKDIIMAIISYALVIFNFTGGGK